jgi:two-component system chemotaxis response regulator CheB
MANRDILAIGTSAGGVEALRFLASKFPPELPASVLMVIHLSSQFRSTLDAILSQAGPLPASFAADGEPVQHRRIYLGPAGRHLLLDGDKIRLGIGPTENNARPSIDPMFRSVGACCGHRAIGVVLTGALGDGSAGLYALKQCGGITVVQDPEDAAHPSMPMSALRKARVDHVESLASMPALLDGLVHQRAGPQISAPATIRYEVEIAESGRSSMSNMDRISRRSVAKTATSSATAATSAMPTRGSW